MEGRVRSRVQGGWGGEGGVTRLNSERGRRSLGNEVHPRDRERIADIGNEADRQPEHNSNSPPWVVNVSKVI